MHGTKKKIILTLIFILLCTLLNAQKYQIHSIEYEIDGVTREDRLSIVVPINKNAVFGSLDSLEKYLTNLQVRYQRYRMLESAFITPIYGEPNEDGIILVDLFILITDSWNVIPFPYPKFDSNTGTELKLKILDYNFLGYMSTLNTDFLYKHDTDKEEGEEDDHIFGASASFGLPFKLGPVTSTWNNSLNLNYTLEEDSPYVKFSTGFRFYYWINTFFALDLRLTQSITYDSGDDYKYKDAGDAFYFTEYGWFGLPVTIARTTLGNLSLTPYISATHYWDADGITHEDFIDTDLHFGYNIWFGRGVLWNKEGLGNFRDGYSIAVNQSFHNELERDRYYLSNSLTATYYKSFEQVQIASRLYFFERHGSKSDLGWRVRGFPNDAIETDSAVIINFDLPIKIWQTDWVGYGLWDWTDWADFELQISPFIDIALGKNYVGGKDYDLQDSWYAAGLEVLIYPTKSRSLIGRVSMGVDLVKFAEKIGNNIGFVAPIVARLFGDTSWRWKEESWYEFTLGIGLFY